MADSRYRKYWALRTDQDNRNLLWEEALKGRLRQGWGYDERQDLEKLQEKKQAGQKKKDLSETEQAAWPNLKMLGAREGAMQEGDLVLLPNLPTYGTFALAEVTGPYRFNPLALDGDEQVHGLTADYGHILPIELLSEQGIDKSHEAVHAEIRSTLRTPMRMWNADGYADHVDRLVEAIEAGSDLSTPTTTEGRSASVWHSAVSRARKALKEQLAGTLDENFQSAEWEVPLREALERLYPSAQVDRTAGPAEHGADLVVRIPNYLGRGDEGESWLVLVQVKNYDGTIASARLLDQLEEAFDYYGEEGEVLTCVALTTASEVDESLEERKKRLEDRLGVPVEIMLRPALLDLMAESFRLEAS